jgi:MoaA/NifB/PqqE/SkfB family radical SAM enzyme
MPHDLLAAPFLGQRLLLHPGSTAGVQLPRGHFDQLAGAAAAGGPCPSWLPGLARDTWQVQLPGSGPMGGRVLVRQESPFGYGRASWEINLGCNYACSHCYLGLKEFAGLPWPDKERLLLMMRDAGVVWLQITGGEPTIDKDFPDAYRLAFELGMMITVSTNGSRLWHPNLLGLFTDLPPYRLVISLYGATEAAYDGLTQRRGSYKAFRRGIAAALEAGLPVRVNIVVTDVSADETQAMAAMVAEWGVEGNVYTNMQPTIYGTGETLLAQSAEHLRTRPAFTGCNAGHTFFHSDPHGLVSICKIGRDDQIDLMAEGLEGLHRLGGIADQLMLRTGGCSGCQLAGTCRVCRPLAKRYQEAKAPLGFYCQHGDNRVKETAGNGRSA